MLSRRLKTSAQGDLLRRVTLTICTVLAFVEASDALSLVAEDPPGKVVTLYVTAIDANGHAVTNLTSADFQIFDNGKLQHIVSFKPPAAQSGPKTAPATTVILFDLLNANFDRRGYESGLLVHALEPLEAGNSVYLALLTNSGDFYPVGGPAASQAGMSVPSPEDVDGKQATVPWTAQVRSLLDQAIQKEYGFRPVDDANPGVQAEATFRTLSELAERLAEIPGQKTIVWITRGTPNWVEYPYGCKDVEFPDGSGSYLAGKCSDICRLPHGKCLDYTPFLQHFSEVLERTDTRIYSVRQNVGSALPPTERGTAEDTLHRLADLTGGAIYSDGQTENAIVDSLKKAPARYRLAYQAPRADGKYHRLRVVSTQAGVRIKSQQGYFAVQP